MATNDTVTEAAAKPRAPIISAGRKMLGDILIMQGVINSKQLEQAHSRQKQGLDGKLPLGAVLIKLGFATEEEVTRARAAQMNIGYASPDILGNLLELPGEIVAAIPPEAAMHYMLLPLGRSSDGRALRVVSSNWTNQSYEAAKGIAENMSLGIEPMLGSERFIRPAVQHHYGKLVAQAPPAAARPGNGAGGHPISAVPAIVDEKSATPVRAKLPTPAGARASDVLAAVRRSGATVPGQDSMVRGDVNVDIQDFSVDQPVIIQFVNKIIADAIRKRASDIHLEPLRDQLEIKYRIDGALHSIDMVPKHYQNACVSRIKVMSDMNIAERRIPQDGRISVTLNGRQIDLRVSSLPSSHGEAVVLRILDRTTMRLDIDHLGFSERNLKALKSVISKPHGICLATGPTGSGKTTTLYAALQSIKTPDINIITVEDPIEYELEGVRQSNTNEKAGLTFARQLRAILRQDPDVIYVGEIRDPETAEIAFRAALTGHLVFSTLHCNDSAGAVTRLLNMGMDPFLIASSVIGVLAQRLVRKVCPHCACRYEPKPEELAALGLNPNSQEVKQGNFLKGQGCPECDKSGYFGRYSIQELLLMDDEVRQLTLDRSPSTRIRQAAINASHNPMIPMRRDGALKVLEGITTADEVQRRVFLEDDWETETTPPVVVPEAETPSVAS
jgi:type II secretory ATPase GspE/PulE/Tfp pilus assembly ATPase PilB-like protein